MLLCIFVSTTKVLCMSDFEFLNYLPTPEETYFRGIVTARIYGKIVVKYRVVNKKDGSGYFIAPPSYLL